MDYLVYQLVKDFPRGIWEIIEKGKKNFMKKISNLLSLSGSFSNYEIIN
jgi:hypothetical protein